MQELVVRHQPQTEWAAQVTQEALPVQTLLLGQVPVASPSSSKSFSMLSVEPQFLAISETDAAP